MMTREEFVNHIVDMFYKMDVNNRAIANTLVVVVDKLSDFDYSEMAKVISKKLHKEIMVIEKLANEKHMANSVYFACYGIPN